MDGANVGRKRDLILETVFLVLGYEADGINAAEEGPHNISFRANGGNVGSIVRGAQLGIKLLKNFAASSHFDLDIPQRGRPFFCQFYVQ